MCKKTRAEIQAMLEMGIDDPSFPMHLRLIQKAKNFFEFSAIRRYVYHDKHAGFRTWGVWWCSAFSWDESELVGAHGPQAKIHDLLVGYIVTNSNVI